MSTSISTNESKYQHRISPRADRESQCSHCGGNGYMKTSPNCYHTCLECVGRGLIADDLS